MEEPENNHNHNKIKHLVISGGGTIGFSIYTAIRESNKAGYWKLGNLETIFATSAGGIMAVMLVLQYDWEIIDEFLLKRPWGAVFQINPNCVLSAFNNRGLFDRTQMNDVFAPLFGGKDIPMDITLQGFYERTHVEIHFFATELNGGLSSDVDFSYKTHPDWLLIDALYCSCCIPGLFQPFIRDEKCFVDGGVFLNYPIRPCLDRVGHENGRNVMGFKRNISEEFMNRRVNAETTLLDTVMIFINKMMERALVEETPYEDVQEICIDCLPLSITELFLAFNSEKERNRLFEIGVECWRKHQASMEE